MFAGCYCIAETPTLVPVCTPLRLPASYSFLSYFLPIFIGSFGHGVCCFPKWWLTFCLSLQIQLLNESVVKKALSVLCAPTALTPIPVIFSFLRSTSAWVRTHVFVFVYACPYAYLCRRLMLRCLFLTSSQCLFCFCFLFLTETKAYTWEVPISVLSANSGGTGMHSYTQILCRFWEIWIQGSMFVLNTLLSQLSL